MQVLLEIMKNINDTLPYVFAHEHNSIDTRFMEKFLSKKLDDGGSCHILGYVFFLIK